MKELSLAKIMTEKEMANRAEVSYSLMHAYFCRPELNFFRVSGISKCRELRQGKLIWMTRKKSGILRAKWPQFIIIFNNVYDPNGDKRYLKGLKNGK